MAARRRRRNSASQPRLPLDVRALRRPTRAAPLAAVPEVRLCGKCGARNVIPAAAAICPQCGAILQRQSTS